MPKPKADPVPCTCIPLTRWTVSPESIKTCPKHGKPPKARIIRRREEA